jgi:hypothetical protein
MRSKLTGRKLKQHLHELLKSSEFGIALERIRGMADRRTVIPLFSALHSPEEEIKWRAVRAMGVVVAQLARADMEVARDVMRRLMWRLNDESGGIGWGAPEAMGEIMACHQRLAEEYSPMLLSYLRRDGNYLENVLLIRGALWGICRLAEARPEVLSRLNAGRYLLVYLDSTDAISRALAVRSLGYLGYGKARAKIKELLQDENVIETFEGERMGRRRVSELAKEALEQIA